MPLALPLDCAKVAVAPQVELSDETSKSVDGRVAVMPAVRAAPLTAMFEEAEAVPANVESAGKEAAAEMVGVEAEVVACVSVEELALVPPEFTARTRT